ncbi:MAG: hypothetical protein ACREHV_15205 [Rhizomicrobium sp.]
MRQAILDNLRALISRRATPEDQKEYQAQVDAITNHRGAALLIGANVENTLENAIVKFLAPDRTKYLFRDGAPLGTFSNKILMGYALDLYGDDTFANLDVIRQIRNAFAHAKIPISFETPELIAACDLLNVDSLIDDHYGEPIPAGRVLEGKERFKCACHWVSVSFFKVYLVGPVEIERAALKVPLSAKLVHIAARPKPLP